MKPTPKIDAAIQTIDSAICKHISNAIPNDRGFLSQSILQHLRHFVEHINLKVYARGRDMEDTYENLCLGNEYVKIRGQYRFLSRFHSYLQKTISHYTPDEDVSERLMLKYYEYLIKIKVFLKKEYDLDILNNLSKFPIATDSDLNEYYYKIAEQLKLPSVERSKSPYRDRLYIQKVRPFFVNENIYYEVTFTIANDRASKFDRIIAFTKEDLAPYYAVKLSVSNAVIEVFNKRMPIQIIDEWQVSVRPCEWDRLADFFGKHPKQGNTVEYRNLMRFLTSSGLNLVEIIEAKENYYSTIKHHIIRDAKSTNIFDTLDKCRSIIVANAPGSNVLKYLLLKLNNKILKDQYSTEACGKLSNLYMQYGCIPFDEMPYCTSLLDHNQSIIDLLECIDPINREHEFLARRIKNNIDNGCQLYTPRKELEQFTNIDELILRHNSKLYWKQKHQDRKLEVFKDHIYIKSYDDTTISIIEKLRTLSSSGIKNYQKSVDAWLHQNTHLIDSDEKREFLRNIFENSQVALIYGAAGTGKSTFVNHVSNFFHDKKKLYLANTNPAVANLERRVETANCTFLTIAKFKSGRTTDVNYDILVIDEASTVCNADMLEVLEKAKFKLLILVGDTYQIESITFGNWFYLAKDFVHKKAIFELTKPYRTENEKLLTLWDKVRKIEGDILEHLTKNGYTKRLDETIFDRNNADQIILCLNYDGLYGINNINKFLQGSNPSPSVEWVVQTYKINDPVLFNETERFTPLIYNNLKGRIVGICEFEDSIQFDVEIEKVINQLDAAGYDLTLLENSTNGNSVIRFSVNRLQSTDEDDAPKDTVVPFQVAYAVSIHKAQGLEYESVKLVITDQIDEMITHNLFYTAITRAKNELTIYWTPNSENKILSGFQLRNNGKDSALLKFKHNLN